MNYNREYKSVICGERKMEESEEKNERESGDSSQEQHGEKIVMNHVRYSMVAGAMPFPLVDIVAVSAIQVDMIKQLADLYGVDYSQERGKSLTSSIVGATFGNFLGRAGASLLKFIPGIGTILGIGSQVLFAGGFGFGTFFC